MTKHVKACGGDEAVGISPVQLPILPPAVVACQVDVFPAKRRQVLAQCLVQSRIAETTADPNPYGFRIGRSTADAIEKCFTLLSQKHSPRWVLEGDIRGCFDYINHGWILRHLPTDKEVLRKWLKAGYVEKGRLFETRAGTPQGGIISPTLANLTLDGLETLLAATFKRRNSRGGRYDNPKVALVRYADDFIVTGASKDLLENEVHPVVERFLRERGLELSPEKSCASKAARCGSPMRGVMPGGRFPSKGQPSRPKRTWRPIVAKDTRRIRTISAWGVPAPTAASTRSRKSTE